MKLSKQADAFRKKTSQLKIFSLAPLIMKITLKLLSKKVIWENLYLDYRVHIETREAFNIWKPVTDACRMVGYEL